jgi:hypothetical protein
VTTHTIARWVIDEEQLPESATSTASARDEMPQSHDQATGDHHAIYLPTRCTCCGHAALAPASTATTANCARCRSGPVRVVPGEAYRAEDIDLFERITAAVETEALPDEGVRSMVAELSDVAARSETPVRSLARLLEAVPALRFLEPGQSRAERELLVHALGMVLAVLAARAEHLAPHGAVTS